MKRSSPLKWSNLASVGRARLMTALPEIDRIEHPIVDLFASLVALSQCRFTVALTPHSVEADVDITPSIPRDLAAANFHDLIVELITNRARTSSLSGQLPVSQRIEDEGFLSFVILLLKAGVPGRSTRAFP